MTGKIPHGIAIVLLGISPAFAQVAGPPIVQPNLPLTKDDAANSVFEQMLRDGGRWPSASFDKTGMSDPQRRRIAAQQQYFRARLTKQQCDQQITKLEKQLPSATGDRKARIERQFLTQHTQRRAADLAMAGAWLQWRQLDPQAGGGVAGGVEVSPQSQTGSLRQQMDIRQGLYAGDSSAIQDALAYMRHHFGLMPEGLSAYDWLAGSELFGPAIRGFVLIEAEGIRVRLRAGDESAVADAWKLWRFIHVSDFWFSRYPDVYTGLSLSDLFGNAMREFIRKKIEQIRKDLEDGDEDAVDDARRFWRFVHYEMFQFSRYPDWHDVFISSEQFADAYKRFLEVIEEDLRRRLREGDPNAVRAAAGHLKYKQGSSVSEGEPRSDADLVAGSTEFGDAYRDGFGGQ